METFLLTVLLIVSFYLLCVLNFMIGQNRLLSKQISTLEKKVEQIQSAVNQISEFDL